MWELDYKESCGLKNWCFWTVVLKILKSPLDCKEIQPLHPQGNQSWIFIGRTDAETETPIFGLLIRRTDSFEKTVMLGKFEGERRRGQQRMASPTQWIWVWASSRSWWWIGGLVCCSPWGLKESDMIEQLNWTKLNTCYNINEPCKHYVKWKKPVTKGHILYDSIYVKFPE